jgi:PKD repeat protein
MATGIGIMLVLTTFVGMSTNVGATGLPPVAEAGGPYNGNECESMLLTAAGSSDPEGANLSYRWNIGGVWIDNYYNLYLDWTWLDDFSDWVTLEVSDGDLTATDTAYVTISNLAPEIISINSSTNIELGTELPMAVHFFDGIYDWRGFVSSLDTYTATFSWGDGSAPTVLDLGVEEFWANASHLYTEVGVYDIIITIVDDNDGEVSTIWEVSVNAKLVDAGPDALIDEGSIFTSAGFLADSEGSSYFAIVDYGDGTGVQDLLLNPGNVFDLQHQYYENGVYSVYVTIFNRADENTFIEWGSDSVFVTVRNVAPIAVMSNDGPKGEGSAVTVSFSGQYDPGIFDTLSYSFDWNDDGTYELIDQPADSATYTFSDNGLYTVKGMIKDDDGGFSEYTTVVDVRNVAPTAMLSNDGPKDQGSPVTVSFTDQYDPGLYDSFTYSFDWDNDGIYEITDLSNAVATNTWYDSGTYTVRGMIKDNDGGFTEYTTIVSVLNVAPTAILSNDGPKDEGSLVMISFTDQYDPDPSDTFTYSFDWNNDGVYEIIDQSSASASYTWYDNGLYTVRGKIKDNHGGFNEYTTMVTINNVPPTIISLSGPSATPVQLGTPIPFVGVFTDPGIFDTHIALIDWGDGQTSLMDLPAGIYQVSGNHTYASAGVYTINLTVIDNDGGSDSASIVVEVKKQSCGCGWMDFSFFFKCKKGCTTPCGEYSFHFLHLNTYKCMYKCLWALGTKMTCYKAWY